ncbi:MAG: hypothetical protein COA45_11765 [Zetaproteobacteria bacterium]|nr:MAG: hypothetical protein COA45_11765 [Zetaproteobacteria bacterium]
MDNVENVTSTAAMIDVGHNFAMVGLFIALLAFCLSVATPWILDAFSPPAPVIKDVIVESPTTITENILAVFGFGDVAPEVEVKIKETASDEEAKHWTDYWSLIVVLIAFGGIVNGALGLLRKDTRILGGIAIFFGISAILTQYLMIVFVAVIIIVLIVGILSSLGVSF